MFFFSAGPHPHPRGAAARLHDRDRCRSRWPSVGQCLGYCFGDDCHPTILDYFNVFLDVHWVTKKILGAM